MSNRAKQVNQKDLSDNEKCEGGICKSTDTHWTKMCDKHRNIHETTRARWQHDHVHGPGSPMTGAELDQFTEEHK